MKINSLKRNIYLITLIILASHLTACEKNNLNDKTSVHFAIKNSINLLEQKNYSSFIAKYLHPYDLNKIYKRISRNNFINQFSKKAATKMLNALKSAEGTKPHYSYNNKAAYYTIQPGYRKLILVKYKNNWYIINTENPKPYLK